VQYAAWTAGDDADAAQIAWDNELVPELRDLVEPGDNEFFEVAFQSAFIGTELPLELTRKRIEVIVITGPIWTGVWKEMPAPQEISATCRSSSAMPPAPRQSNRRRPRSSASTGTSPR